MSDLPEQIWAKATTWGDGKPLCGDWNYCDVGHTDDREYVRADTVQAQIDAAREAALREVAFMAENGTLPLIGVQCRDAILTLINKGDQL
jgi:hypothetical protein